MEKMIVVAAANRSGYWRKWAASQVVQRNAPRWIKMLVKHGFLPAAA
jgi:hypothetical protein